MTPWLNSVSTIWFDWMVDMMWQSAVLIAIVWAADRLLRRFAWPQFRFMLWLLVFIKLLLPPGFGLPTSVTASAIAAVRQFIKPGIVQPDQPAIRQAVTNPVKSIQTNPAPLHLDTAAPPVSWQTKLMIVWLAGIFLLVFWLYWRLRCFRVDRSSWTSPPEWFWSALQDCTGKLSMNRVPDVAIASTIRSPAVFGIFRPVVLIPDECIGMMDREQASNVFLHELMHIKRYDPLIQALQIFFQIIYWPNILLWLIRRPVHDLRELCCDAAVAAALHENTASYRQTLIHMARQLIGEPANPGLCLLGLFEQPHMMVTRLKYLEKPYGGQRLCKYLSAVMAIVMLVSVLPMSSIRAQTDHKQILPSEATNRSTIARGREHPRFEVISIKRSPHSHYSDTSFLPGGRYRAVNATLALMISESYRIPLLQVIGIPKSLEKVGWDIEAKPEDGKYSLGKGLLDREVSNIMLQSLLEDRFKLKIHREIRILPGYELIVAKGGPRFKLPEEKNKPNIGIWYGHLQAPSASLSEFASYLSLILARTPVADKIGALVVDKTGLAGKYDFKLAWTPDLRKASLTPQTQPAVDSELSFFDALQEQLGLKLIPAKLPTPVVVIDEVQLPEMN